MRTAKRRDGTDPVADMRRRPRASIPPYDLPPTTPLFSILYPLSSPSLSSQSASVSAFQSASTSSSLAAFAR